LWILDGRDGSRQVAKGRNGKGKREKEKGKRKKKKKKKRREKQQKMAEGVPFIPFERGQ